jgi:hypothetical protein
MSNISDRITEYLGSGGLFNPEAMEHEKVRDLLIDCRAYVDALRAAAGKVTCWRCEGFGELKSPYEEGAGMDDADPCPDCTDLRALLTKEKQP